MFDFLGSTHYAMTTRKLPSWMSTRRCEDFGGFEEIGRGLQASLPERGGGLDSGEAGSVQGSQPPFPAGRWTLPPGALRSPPTRIF